MGLDVVWLVSGYTHVFLLCTVRSKDAVHECETEFGVFPVTDVVNIKKRKFIA